MPNRFTRPPFNSYNRKADPMEHVSHYIHMMSLHTHNDALMCKVFPSSLGSTALRWFNGLWKGSIRSFAELIKEFGARFVTCSRVPQLVDALLSIKMGVGETLRSYVSQDWELYNEIGGGNEKIAASTFRMGLPENLELRESLTKRHPEDMRQLMRHIEEYKRLEDDRLMCKVFPLSLGSTALRWFNGLRKGSIRSFTELIQEFGARFVTCSRVPQPVDALLSIKMGVGETLRNYVS